MAKIFNDFHFQIFVQMFVFNSWPKKQHSLYEKSAEKLSRCKKMLGLGFISFDKAFSNLGLYNNLNSNASTGILNRIVSNFKLNRYFRIAEARTHFIFEGHQSIHMHGWPLHGGHAEGLANFIH
jgi:hypothetical protein